MNNNEKRCKIYRWTPTAIMCYKRGCICNGCEIREYMESACEMKYTVLELVRTMGKPAK